MSNILLRIESMLDSVVEHALLEAADEKQIQLATTKKIKQDKRKLTAGDDEERVKEAEDDEAAEDEKSGESGGDMSKRPVEIPEKLPATITVDMVVNGIDAIRSARSLKKPEVREEFEQYFNSLSPDEKIGLLAYVYGIAETLIGDSPGRGLDPSEEPYNVQMSSDPDQSADPSTASEPVQGEESEDTPIVVGG